MADKMTFSSVTWDFLEEKYGISAKLKVALFDNVATVEPSAALLEFLRRARGTRLWSERAKAYRLVYPVLSELEMQRKGRIESIPEMTLEVKDKEGLCGTPDFIISAAAAINKVLPILAIVEAKKDDMDTAMPQCVAEMYAAYLLNKERPSQIYGCVTIGTEWQFMCMEGQSKQVRVDSDIYFINQPEKLLGVLCHIVDVSLAALG